MTLPTWGEINTDADGVKTQILFLYGAAAGQVEQFVENEPTTYATVGGRRLGPRDSWEDAKRAVESSLMRFSEAQ